MPPRVAREFLRATSRRHACCRADPRRVRSPRRHRGLAEPCAAHRRRPGVSAEDARGGEGPVVAGPPDPARPSRGGEVAGWANPRVVAARPHPRPSKLYRDCKYRTQKKNQENEPTLPVVNNKKLRQPIRQRLGHARDEPRALHLVLDALHRAGPMNLLHQIAPREGHEAVHEGILGG